jgi:hypothetical protein
MVVFTFHNEDKNVDKELYIDGGLTKALMGKVFPDLQKNDKDAIFIVDGKERSGKSKLADLIAAFASTHLNRPYILNNICFTPEEFRNAIVNSQKNDIIIFDEAHTGMASRRSLSAINTLLVNLMMEMGQKNLFVLIVLPTFFMLDRYPALYRARGLFHVYERKGKRGFWTYYNEAAKLKLYLNGKKFLNYNCMRFPRFKGRFLNQWAVDEQDYRDKKRTYFSKSANADKLYEKFLLQRNLLINFIYEYFKNIKRLTQIETLKIIRNDIGINIDLRGFKQVLYEIRAREKTIPIKPNEELVKNQDEALEIEREVGEIPFLSGGVKHFSKNTEKNLKMDYDEFEDEQPRTKLAPTTYNYEEVM